MTLLVYLRERERERERERSLLASSTIAYINLYDFVLLLFAGDRLPAAAAGRCGVAPVGMWESIVAFRRTVSI